MAVTQEQSKEWVLSFVNELISTTDVNHLVKSPEQFAYQGFDPIKTLIVLHQRKTEKGISDQQFKEDMGTMISFGLMRGNLKPNTLKKMSGEGIKRIQEIQNAYKIVNNISSDSSSDTVTIPRVINALPLMASRINESYSIGRDFNGPLESLLLPLCMKHTGFAALIPKLGKIGIFLQNVYIAHSFDLHCVVNNIGLDKLDQTVIDQQYVYFNNSLESKMFSEQDRVKIIRSFKLGSEKVYEYLLSVFQKVKQEELWYLKEEPPTLEEYLKYFQESSEVHSSGEKERGRKIPESKRLGPK